MDLYRRIWPLLRRIDPERAHRLAIAALRAGFGPRTTNPDPPGLATRLWGFEFPNPLGLAAGFDKDAEAVGPSFRLGFGFVEVGSITPEAQPGNPRPRLFRLIEDRAVINRMGFNSRGLLAVRRNLEKVGRERSGVLGINLGKNKDSVDAAEDYRRGAEELGALADYLVVNVSSPNTPGLRALQGRAPLEDLLGTFRAELGRLPKDLRPPLVLKISPDLMPEDLADIAAVALSGGMEGIAIGNTTIDRPAALMSRHRYEAGGLSGRPLLEPSTRLLGETFRLTEGNIPLIGIGGVDSGEAAYRKIRAGASLVQLYTALIFEGPLLVGRIKSDLSALLHRDDFTSVAAAVGCDHRKKTGA